ncbi:MAG TPA: Gfo/Idh/MocA family oxidoreductase [Bryobacteraceae bacterium]|jgi:predicted dehydrogenase|nr:Gfo/Idh/MocA family oxidoreductase [Bryobacteraceae bacterium]
MIHRLKAAVFGTGFVGRVHLEGIRRLGFVQVYAIGESQKEKARKLGEEFHVDKTASDYRALLDDPEVDVVHICTPNALHFPMAKESLEAGKHVICEKPLATSIEDGMTLVNLAKEKNLANATSHNLRYYPQVQNMRRMREAGELGEILAVQGTYSQDWLLYDTDWNWRIDSKANGRSRCMADIGSHWCDMAEHVTGMRITSLCADLQTFHKTRKKPKKSLETFAGKLLKPEDYEEVPIDTEDFGAVIFRMGERTRGAFTASQVAAGCKNRLSIEIYGSKASVAWNQERPDELWIGQRNTPNQIIIKDPSLLQAQAKPFADLPGGHSEGYDDTFKQLFRRFYHTVEDRASAVEYPQFIDGVRQLQILNGVLDSADRRAWVDLPQAHVSAWK